MSPLVGLFIHHGIKDNLGNSLPVTQINKNQVPQVSSGINPSHQSYYIPAVLQPESAAVMSPNPVIQIIYPHMPLLLYLSTIFNDSKFFSSESL